MKIFYSEIPAPDYETYTFPYAVYALQEREDEIADIYHKGFLPYTDTGIHLPEQPVYYLARSIRIRLDDFSLSSENRRIRRKMEDWDPTFRVVDKEELRNDNAFWDFCRQYAARRIGPAMNDERLHYIFDHPLMNRIFVFSGSSGILGYVWTVDRPPAWHYWFAFFDLNYMRQGIGKWMMEQVISHARRQGYGYAYLGTCYGEKALYKVRDFKAVEFFNGEKWSGDISVLKAKCKEGTSSGPDEWKRLRRKFSP